MSIGWGPMRRWLACALLLLSASGSACAAEYLELIIPLKDGRTYSRREFCRACNMALKAGYPLEKISDRPVELTRGELTLLRALEVTGAIREVRLEKDRLVLGLPNPEDDKSRMEMRERLGRAFGLDVQAGQQGKGLLVPADFDPGKRTILFIHGLGSTSRGAFAGFIEACGKRDIQVLTFDYPSHGPIAKSGQHLARELEGFAKRHPSAKFAIVAHSMGGLVARYALEKEHAAPGRVSDLFLVATPHQGSRLAYYEELLLFVQQRLDRRPAKEKMADGLGEAGVDLRPGSEVVRVLDQVERAPGVRYHVVAGTRALVDARDVPDLEKEFQRFLKRLRLPPEEEERLLAQLSRLDEIVHGKGDGAVTVASARLAGVNSVLTVECNHLDLVEGGERSPVFRHILQVLGWKTE